MTLTKFSDYSLRLQIYLGLHDDPLVSVGEISRAYRVSPHILVKVVQLLTEQELIVSVRGRNGGFRLSKSPWLIPHAQWPKAYAPFGDVSR